MNRQHVAMAVASVSEILTKNGLDPEVASDVARNTVSSYTIDPDPSYITPEDHAEELRRRVRDFPADMSPIAGCDLDAIAVEIHNAINDAFFR